MCKRRGWGWAGASTRLKLHARSPMEGVARVAAGRMATKMNSFCCSMAQDMNSFQKAPRLTAITPRMRAFCISSVIMLFWAIPPQQTPPVNGGRWWRRTARAGVLGTTTALNNGLRWRVTLAPTRLPVHGGRWVMRAMQTMLWQCAGAWIR